MTKITEVKNLTELKQKHSHLFTSVMGFEIIEDTLKRLESSLTRIQLEAVPKGRGEEKINKEVIRLVGFEIADDLELIGCILEVEVSEKIFLKFLADNNKAIQSEDQLACLETIIDKK